MEYGEAKVSSCLRLALRFPTVELEPGREDESQSILNCFDMHGDHSICRPPLADGPQLPATPGMWPPCMDYFLGHFP
jgi:hypothetical protein